MGLSLRPLTAVAVLLAGALPVPALAWRCPGGLVAVGDHAEEVLDACGEPDARRPRAEYPYRVDGSAGHRRVDVLLLPLPAEEWLYSQGRERFRRLLILRNNRVVAIELLDKPR